jgi:hypothetical protein
LPHPLADAVVGVGALVRAGEVVEARVLGDLEGHAVLLPELFQLGHHAVGDAGRALGEQTLHHALLYKKKRRKGEREEKKDGERSKG